MDKERLFEGWSLGISNNKMKSAIVGSRWGNKNNDNNQLQT